MDPQRPFRRPPPIALWPPVCDTVKPSTKRSSHSWTTVVRRRSDTVHLTMLRLLALRLRSRGRLRTARDVRVGRGVRVEVAPGARVVLGRGATLGSGGRIEAVGGLVRLGAGARLGERAIVVSHAGVEIGPGAVL